MFMKRECNMFVTSEPFPTPASDYRIHFQWISTSNSSIPSVQIHYINGNLHPLNIMAGLKIVEIPIPVALREPDNCY